MKMIKLIFDYMYHLIAKVFFLIIAVLHGFFIYAQNLIIDPGFEVGYTNCYDGIPGLGHNTQNCNYCGSLSCQPIDNDLTFDMESAYWKEAKHNWDKGNNYVDWVKENCSNEYIQNDSIRKEKYFELMMGISHSPMRIPNQNYAKNYWQPKNLVKPCLFIATSYNISFTNKFILGIHYSIGLNRFVTQEYFFRDSLPVQNNNPYEYKSRLTFLYHSLGIFFTRNVFLKSSYFSFSIGLTTESYLFYFYKTLIFEKVDYSNNYTANVYKTNSDFRYYFKQSNFFNLWGLNVDLEKKFRNKRYSLLYRFRYGFPIGIGGFYSHINSNMFVNSLIFKLNFN